MDKKRVSFLDEIRGFAILCMVVYHVMYDLRFIYGVDVPFFFEAWFDVIRDIFAGMFIFISGTVCRYSSNNLKRGAQCFFLGMILTFVTAFSSPTYPILFGILHMLGISMLIYGLLEKHWDKLPAALGMILFALLFALSFNVRSGYIGTQHIFTISLPDSLYQSDLMFPLGFISARFASSDYFPLLPWLFLFISGNYFGVFAVKGRLPKFFYNKHIPFLALTGRYTIWIYLLHQPIAMLILNIIFR